MENKQEPTFTTGLEKLHIPALGERRRPKYRWKAMLYKKIAIALGVMLLGIGYLLFLTLRGNLSLQKQLAEKPTFMIMPSGKTAIINPQSIQGE